MLAGREILTDVEDCLLGRGPAPQIREQLLQGEVVRGGDRPQALLPATAGVDPLAAQNPQRGGIRHDNLVYRPVSAYIRS